MKIFYALLSSEFIKLRRTLALWMLFIAPLIVLSLQCLLWLNQKEGIGYDADLWIMFASNILSMWAIFMFPLFSALVVSLVYHYEHSTNGWQKLYTLPVPRWKIIATKQTASLLLLVASGVVLFIGIIAGGFFVGQVHPAIDMPQYIPYGTILKKWSAVFASSLLVVAVQNWISFRYSTLSASIGAGIAGTFIALFASGWKYGHFYPWLMALHALFDTDGRATVSLVAGTAGGMIVLIAMNIIESNRERAG